MIEHDEMTQAAQVRGDQIIEQARREAVMTQKKQIVMWLRRSPT